MEYLISMYIDNELDLDEKRNFVEQVHESREYKDVAVSLLDQEKKLHAMIPNMAPEISLQKSRRSTLPSFANSAGLALAASLLIVFGLFFKGYQPAVGPVNIKQAKATHRFVIYQTGINSAEITGSFTNWQRVSLQPAGMTGYWETTLELPAGEHRFVYILDDKRMFADPTVLNQETDDYGAINSIITIEGEDYEI